MSFERFWPGQSNRPPASVGENPPVAVVFTVHGLALTDLRQVHAVSRPESQRAFGAFASEEPTLDQVPQPLLDCRSPRRDFEQFLINAISGDSEARSADGCCFQKLAVEAGESHKSCIIKHNNGWRTPPPAPWLDAQLKLLHEP